MQPRALGLLVSGELARAATIRAAVSCSARPTAKAFAVVAEPLKLDRIVLALSNGHESRAPGAKHRRRQSH